MQKHFLVVNDPHDQAWLQSLEVVLAAFGTLNVITEDTVLSQMDLKHYDMVILDAIVIKDVLKLLAYVREHYPDVKVVITTTSPEWRLAREAFRVGASDYIRKSQDTEELHQTFEPLLSRSVSPEDPHESMPEPETRRELACVSVVHGRDELIKNTVVHLLNKLHLGTYILPQSPGGSPTIIEKFDEGHTEFAVVLLTPDEQGTSQHLPSTLKPRASQNIIFTLGYLLGRLGYGKVVALYQQEIEMPSDDDRILYIPIDNRGDWKLQLAKEIKNSGINIDLNQAI